MGFLGFLGTPLGYVLKWMYDFLGSYGWALVVFTILIRLLSFPLQLKQKPEVNPSMGFRPTSR